MKCHFCGKDGLDKAMQFWQDDEFRIACDECFSKEMTKAGYLLRNDGNWYKYWQISEQETK